MELASRLNDAESGNDKGDTKLGTRGRYTETWSDPGVSQYQTTPASGGTGVASCIINLLNAIIGGGLVAMSEVAGKVGIVFFCIALLSSMTMATITLRFLSSSSLMSRQRSYESIGVAAFGPVFGRYVVSSAIVLKGCGSLTFYAGYAKNSSNLINDVTGWTIPDWWYSIGVAICLIAPLCALKDISFLAPVAGVSFFACICMCFTTVSVYFGMFDVLYKSEAYLEHLSTDPNLINFTPMYYKPALIGMIGSVIFAFSCHPMYLNIVSTMALRNSSNMTAVNLGGVGIAGVLYALTGIFGYLSYGGCAYLLGANMRNCVYECPDGKWYVRPVCAGVRPTCAQNNLWIILLNVIFTFAVILGYPTIHFSHRVATLAFLRGPEAVFSWPWHLGVAAFWITATTFVAIVVADATLVFSLIGAVCSPLVNYCLPSAYYFRLSRIEGVPPSSPRMIAACCVFVGGILFSMFNVYHFINANFLPDDWKYDPITWGPWKTQQAMLILNN